MLKRKDPQINEILDSATQVNGVTIEHDLENKTSCDKSSALVDPSRFFFEIFKLAKKNF